MYCSICCAERTQGDNFVSRQPLFCCHFWRRSPSMNLHRLHLWTAIFTMLRPQLTFSRTKGLAETVIKKTESHGCKAAELNPIAVPERCTAVFSLKSSFVLRLRGLLFWLLIFHFMAKGNCVKFDLSHYTVAVLFILESTIVALLIAQVPALQT